MKAIVDLHRKPAHVNKKLCKIYFACGSVVKFAASIPCFGGEYSLSYLSVGFKEPAKF